MKFSWTDEGSNSGPVTGLNRSAVAGETEGNITPQQLVWGMYNYAYKVVSKTFTPVTPVQKAALDAAREAQGEYDENLNWAAEQQSSAVGIMQQSTAQGLMQMQSLEPDQSKIVTDYAQAVEQYRIDLLAAGAGGGVGAEDRPPTPPELTDFYDLVYGG